MHQNLDRLLLELTHKVPLLLEEILPLELLEPTHKAPLLLEEIPPLVLLLANLIQLCLHQLREPATNHRQLHRYQVHRQVFQRWDHPQEALLKEVPTLVKVLMLHPEVPTLVKEVMPLQLQILEGQLLHLLVE